MQGCTLLLLSQLIQLLSVWFRMLLPKSTACLAQNLCYCQILLGLIWSISAPVLDAACSVCSLLCIYWMLELLHSLVFSECMLLSPLLSGRNGLGSVTLRDALGSVAFLNLLMFCFCDCLMTAATWGFAWHEQVWLELLRAWKGYKLLGTIWSLSWSSGGLV